MLRIFRDFRFVMLLLATFTSSVGTGITSVTLPWYVIEQRGEHALGVIMIVVTVTLFLLSPSIGAIVDRFSRKRVLLGAQVLSGGLIACFTMSGIYKHYFSTYDLIVISLAGSLYYTLHLPAFNAIVQEMFHSSQYKTVNTIFEILNQMDPIIAGLLANLMLAKQDLPVILSLDIISYLLSFILIALIPYHPTAREGKAAGQRSGWLLDLSAGFVYLRTHPRLLVFLAASYMTFLIVMAGNYLMPIYIIKELLQPGSFLGLYNAIYASGAIVSGFIVILLINRFGSFMALIGMMSVFAASLLGMFVFRQPVSFLLFALFTGFGNAGTKIIRTTMMMNLIPDAYIGRVSGFYTTFGLLLRLLLLMSFTTVVESSGSLPLIGFITLLAMGSVAVVIWTYRTGRLYQNVRPELERKTTSI